MRVSLCCCLVCVLSNFFFCKMPTSEPATSWLGAEKILSKGTNVSEHVQPRTYSAKGKPQENNCNQGGVSSTRCRRRSRRLLTTGTTALVQGSRRWDSATQKLASCGVLGLHASKPKLLCTPGFQLAHVCKGPDVHRGSGFETRRRLCSTLQHAQGELKHSALAV